MLRKTHVRGRHRAQPSWRVLDLVVVGLSIAFVAVAVGLAVGPGQAMPDTAPDPVPSSTTSAPASVVIDR